MNESDCGTRGDHKVCVCTCSKHPGSSREDQVDRSYARSKYALLSKPAPRLNRDLFMNNDKNGDRMNKSLFMINSWTAIRIQDKMSGSYRWIYSLFMNTGGVPRA